jgi:putative sterol carrier protein
VDETKNELMKRIPDMNANPRAKQLLEVWPRKVQFELDGEKPFYVNFEKGAVTGGDGTIENPDIVMNGNSPIIARVIRGEVDITHPIAHGELSLKKGKIKDLLTFSRVLAIIKKDR